MVNKSKLTHFTNELKHNNSSARECMRLMGRQVKSGIKMFANFIFPPLIIIIIVVGNFFFLFEFVWINGFEN